MSIYKIDGRHDESTAVVSISSFTMPGNDYELNVDNFQLKVIKKSELPDKTYNPDDYTQDQIFYKSKDGTEIPMFIVRKKTNLPSLTQKPNKPKTTLLTAYGGFGSPM